MELRKIIKEFKKIRDEEKLLITDTTLFKEALDLYMSMGIQQGYKTETPKDNLKQEPLATEKQVYALKKLGKYKEGITKKEASAIIKESKENY